MARPVDTVDALTDALNRGDWARAQFLSMHLLREVPPHAGVYFVAGVAAREQRQIPLAISCLEQATSLSPGRGDYQAQLALAYLLASEPTKALAVADSAVAAGSLDARSQDVLGIVYSRTHVNEKAARMFGEIASAFPSDARVRFNYATALIHAGDIDGADRELAACLGSDPEYWKAYVSRAQIRRQTPDNNHVDELRRLLERSAGNVEATLCLNLALSKELEDLGEYPDAFSRLAAGKRAILDTKDYSSAQDAALFRAIMDAFPGADPSPRGYGSEEPIFVIGMPRTGTTLVDRILSSHSMVYSAGELQNFGVALKRASGSRTPPMLDEDAVRRARNLDWAELGRQYVESTRPQTSAKPRFTANSAATVPTRGRLKSAARAVSA